MAHNPALSPYNPARHVPIGLTTFSKSRTCCCWSSASWQCTFSGVWRRSWIVWRLRSSSLCCSAVDTSSTSKPRKRSGKRRWRGRRNDRVGVAGRQDGDVGPRNGIAASLSRRASSWGRRASSWGRRVESRRHGAAAWRRGDIEEAVSAPWDRLRIDELNCSAKISYSDSMILAFVLPWSWHSPPPPRWGTDLPLAANGRRRNYLYWLPFILTPRLHEQLQHHMQMDILGISHCILNKGISILHG